MGPFTPLFSSGVPVAVMCCKDFPQKNLCCAVSLLPFKKSAMSEIYLLSGSSSSLVFFLSISFCSFSLALSLGVGALAGRLDVFCCGLTTMTAACWLFLFSCFRDDSSTRRSPSASASRRGFPRRFSVFFSSFGVFRVFVVPA